jgi:hypothetical protein
MGRKGSRTPRAAPPHPPDRSWSWRSPSSSSAPIPPGRSTSPAATRRCLHTPGWGFAPRLSLSGAFPQTSGAIPPSPALPWRDPAQGKRPVSHPFPIRVSLHPRCPSSLRDAECARVVPPMGTRVGGGGWCASRCRWGVLGRLGLGPWSWRPPGPEAPPLRRRRREPAGGNHPSCSSWILTSHVLVGPCPPPLIPQRPVPVGPERPQILTERISLSTCS